METANKGIELCDLTALSPMMGKIPKGDDRAVRSWIDDIKGYHEARYKKVQVYYGADVDSIERQRSVVGEVLRNIIEHDKTIRNVIHLGAWDILYHKPSYVVLVNGQINATLVLWKQRVKHRVKGIQIMWRYTLFSEKWDIEKAKEFYSRIFQKTVVYAPNKVNVKKYNKKISDEDRLRINQKRQLEIMQKIEQLQKEYNAIKYKRKKEFKEKKAKLKQLIKGYEQLLNELKKAEKELEKKLGIRQNAKVLKI